MMIFDRTLLEAAAKAAGEFVWGYSDKEGVLVASHRGPTPWNPFYDEARLYCLAKKLKMRIDFDLEVVVIFTASLEEICIHWGSDYDCASDAEAIFFAAATLGRTL